MRKPPSPPDTRFSPRPAPAPAAGVAQPKPMAMGPVRQAKPVSAAVRAGHPIPPTAFGPGAGVSQPRMGAPGLAVPPPATRFGAVQANSSTPDRSSGRPLSVAQPAIGVRPARSMPGNAVLQPMDRHPRWEKDNKTDNLFHIPSRSASPLRDGQDEILKLVFKDMNELSGKSKKIQRPQPKETVKGSIGEFAAQLEFERNGLVVYDANRTIAKNIDGIDHILDDEKHVFSQSKVYVSGKTLDVDVENYKKAIESRCKMVEDFLKRLAKNKKIKNNFHDLASKVKSKTFLAIDKKIKETDWEDEDIDADHEIVKLIEKHIVFPVPSDVYDRLPKKFRPWCRRLPQDRTWFSSSLRKSYYMNSKKVLSAEEREKKEDPDF